MYLMVKVIETNLSMNDGDEIVDHQSRVIEVESWDQFIEEIREAKTVLRHAALGSMYGNTIPRSSRVEDLVHDEFHLSCNVYNYVGSKTRKLAYLIIT